MDYRAALIEFYKKHNPAKLTEVDALLRKYKGREDELLHALRVKYKAQDPSQTEPIYTPPPPTIEEPVSEMKVVKEEPSQEDETPRVEAPASRYRDAEVTRAGDTKGRTAAERAEYWRKELERRERERGQEREEKRVESNVKQKAERMKVVRETEEEGGAVVKKPRNVKKIAVIVVAIVALLAIAVIFFNDGIRHKLGLADEGKIHSEKAKKEGLDPGVLSSTDSAAKKTGEFVLEDEPDEKAPSIEDAMNEQPSSATKPTPSKEVQTNEDASTQTGVQRKKYYIGYSAVSSEETAKKTAAELRRKGFDNAGYFYIPNYEPSGKSLYRIYVGPFNSIEAAEEMIVNVRSENPNAYSFYLK
ncbi:MAG: SPOR domain-containing protein [Chitinophagales bacterium]|nr:SPOR domain-containing protein [Chitinophagales bacterium]